MTRQESKHVALVSICYRYINKRLCQTVTYSTLILLCKYGSVFRETAGNGRDGCAPGVCSHLPCCAVLCSVTAKSVCLLRHEPLTPSSGTPRQFLSIQHGVPTFIAVLRKKRLGASQYAISTQFQLVTITCRACVQLTHSMGLEQYKFRASNCFIYTVKD